MTLIRQMITTQKPVYKYDERCRFIRPLKIKMDERSVMFNTQKQEYLDIECFFFFASCARTGRI